MMTIHLPEDQERWVQTNVRCGRFASENEAITEAVRLLEQKDQELQPSPKSPLTEEEFDQHLAM